MEQTACLIERTSEGALSLLDPHDPDLSASREALGTIGEFKTLLRQGKPIGARLDAARGAAPRATMRRDAALQTLELARVALFQAETELSDYTCQLRQAEVESTASLLATVSVKGMSAKLHAFFDRLEPQGAQQEHVQEARAMAMAHNLITALSVLHCSWRRRWANKISNISDVSVPSLMASRGSGDQLSLWRPPGLWQSSLSMFGRARAS